jgi:mono/diheme cytochrome c family protein
MRPSARRFALGFFGTLLVLPILAAGAFLLGLPAVNGDSRSPAWQSGLFATAVRAAVHHSASATPSPLAPTEATLVAGGKRYLNTCAGCHGGLGMPPRQHVFFTPPPELCRIGTRYSEPEIYWIVKHGIRRTGMSAYGPFLSEEKLWQVAAFVHRLPDLPPAVRSALTQPVALH